MIFQECNCWFCERGLVQVIHTFEMNGVREFWLDIPKNASTAMKHHFELGKNPSIMPKALYRTMGNHYKPFAIYRDPMDRFVSLLNHYLTPSGPYGRFAKGTAALADMGVDINEVGIHERMELFMEYLPKLAGFHQVHHLYPQTYWLPEEFKEFTWIPMHKVGEIFGIKNTTPGSGIITRDMLTIRQKNFVQEEYRDDYEYFKEML